MARRILFGITGGIAAYKIPHCIRLLRKNGADVKVVLTRNAFQFVGIESLRTVSGFPVYHDDSNEFSIEHIALTKWADCFCIAPATANTIAKLAHGIADNLLTSTALATNPSKIVIAPAMNTGMWQSSITQQNIALLINRGITILPVGHGELACGDSGDGRMIEPEEIVQALISPATPLTLSGKNVLISSGPTEEPIDPVRVITNRSSGKMGAALARKALELGASVTVVSGPASAPLPPEATIKQVRTALEMENALRQHFSDADICIMAAAVSDFRPAAPSSEKIKREETSEFGIKLLPNNDILAGLGKDKSHQLLVGFALESDADESRAQEKMVRKNCDIMVFNKVAIALGNETTEIVILHRDGTSEASGPVSKDDAATKIFSSILSRLDQHHGS